MLKNDRDTNSKNVRFGYLLLGLFLFVGFANSAGAVDKKSAKSKPKSKAISSLAKSKGSDSNQRIIVRFKQSATNSTKARLHQTLTSRVKKTSKTVPGLQVIEVGSGKSIKKVLKQYQQDPAVLYAEPDYKIRLKATYPNDTSFTQLWGLNNTGQTGGANDADINAPEAWDITQGSSSVVVAVVDTGIDYMHVDLADNIWINPGEIANNGIDDDGNGYIDDIHGIDTGDGDTDPMDGDEHGTHVAGTIGARGNNGVGVSGVNWDVKIIACKIFGSNSLDIDAFVSDAVECLDYLRDLKLNRGIDIVATNNSWGWIGPPSQTLMDAVQRQRDAGILFMAASGNDALDTDEFLDNPSSYDIPNIISVAASTHTDGLATFSNYGKRTVHVAAPGQDILSTIPGVATPPVNNPHNDIFFDNVESGIGGWTTQLSWATTTLSSHSATNSWTDSPVGNYLNSTNSSLTSQTVDLSSYASQSVYVGLYVNYDIEDFFDEAHVEISTNSVTWTALESFTGASVGWQFVSLIIPQSHLTATFQLRIRLETDSSITHDGIYIDDIGIGITAPPASNNSASFDGTSMATPHVVGLAALLKAQDGTRTWSEIKNLIISSGTPIGAFTNTTVSGRRIRAFDSNNTGAMSCVNQTVLSRLQPTVDEYGIEPGDLANISMLHINCGVPAGDVTATITESGGTVTLLDDGMGFDQVAGDGVYSAQVDLVALGLEKATLQMPDSSTVYINKIYNYLPATVNTYSWRDISTTGASVIVGDDATGYVDSPFPIPFGNNTTPYTRLAIDTNGYLVMQRAGEGTIFSIFENFEIPMPGLSNMIAAFWDDLVVDGATNLIWGVVGTAPNRELVVTWQNVRAFGGTETITFQVVLAEGSSDVIINYLDVNAESFVDFGIGATVGVQVSRHVGSQYSYDTASLSNGFSLRWAMPTGVSNTPTLPPPVVRVTPGGGGGSFGFLLLLLLPLAIIGRVLGSSETKI